jgi:hypothetical protein
MIVFSSRIEAYSFLIVYFEKSQNTSPSPQILAAVRYLKTCIQDHEQDVLKVSQQLQWFSEKSSLSNDSTLKIILNGLRESRYGQSLMQRFSNPLGRRLETEWSKVFALAPTPKMMASIANLSALLLQTIRVAKKSYPAQCVEFLRYFDLKVKGIYVHALIPKYVVANRLELVASEVERLLALNNPVDFMKIMMIHFSASLYFYRKAPVNVTPLRPPVGELKNLIGKFYPALSQQGAEKKYFQTIGQVTEGYELRAYISDKLICGSALYCAERHRGRADVHMTPMTNQYGLMLATQVQFLKGIPINRETAWIADVHYQFPLFNSQTVIDTIFNDAIYVSGYSGMVSLFLGQMEVVGNFDTVADKKLYHFCACIYIMFSGSHSLHEALAPASFLKLLPTQYVVSTPVAGQLGHPALYSVYFDSMASIDENFSANLHAAWQDYLQFFRTDYLPLQANLLLILEQAETNELVGMTPASASHKQSGLKRSVAIHNFAMYAQKAPSPASAVLPALTELAESKKSYPIAEGVVEQDMPRSPSDFTLSVSLTDYVAKDFLMNSGGVTESSELSQDQTYRISPAIRHIFDAKFAQYFQSQVEPKPSYFFAALGRNSHSTYLRQNGIAKELQDQIGRVTIGDSNHIDLAFLQETIAKAVDANTALTQAKTFCCARVSPLGKMLSEMQDVINRNHTLTFSTLK